MGTLALAIVATVIAGVGLLLLLARRHVARADRRGFGSSHSGGAMLVSDPGHTAGGRSCDGFDAGAGNCAGDGGGGGD